MLSVRRPTRANKGKCMRIQTKCWTKSRSSRRLCVTIVQHVQHISYTSLESLVSLLRVLLTNEVHESTKQLFEDLTLGRSKATAIVNNVLAKTCVDEVMRNFDFDQNQFKSNETNSKNLILRFVFALFSTRQFCLLLYFAYETSSQADESPKQAILQIHSSNAREHVGQFMILPVHADQWPYRIV